MKEIDAIVYFGGHADEIKKGTADSVALIRGETPPQRFSGWVFRRLAIVVPKDRKSEAEKWLAAAASLEPGPKIREIFTTPEPADAVRVMQVPYTGDAK